jgi:hypothetical protein
MSCNDATPKEKNELFCVSAANRMVCCKKILWGAYSTKSLSECNQDVKEVINATNIIIYE